MVGSTLAGVAMAVVMLGAAASAHRASAERGAVRQPTYVTLVGPAVARADGFVTLRGSIGIRGSSGDVSFEEDFVLTNNQGTGTLTIKTQETETPTGNVPVDQGGPFVQTGVWVITSPTGAYNGVTGSGTTVWNGGTLTLSLTGMMTKVG